MISIPVVSSNSSPSCAVPSAFGAYTYYNSPIGKIDKTLSSGKIGTFISNQLTGDLDYSRQLELQDRANAFTASESAKAREYNAQQAQIQRDFEERLSNSAYTRAFADMRKNGINPYAMISSASTPSGAVASSSGGRSASAFAPNSGKALSAFLGSVVASAFAYAGRALSARVSANSSRYYFDSDGTVTGGYYGY